MRKWQDLTTNESYDISKSDARFREAMTSGGFIASWKLNNAGFQVATAGSIPSPDISVGQTTIKRPLQVVNSSPSAIVSSTKKLKFIDCDIDED